MPRIDEFLKALAARRGSDLHLTTGFKPFLRVDGDIKTMDEFAVIGPTMMTDIVLEIMPSHNKTQFEETWDTDFAYSLSGIGRFRVNVFRDRYGMGCVLRLIPSRIPTLDELGVPRAVRDFCMLSKGLVLVTGPTGSGKSTTLAALLELINATRTEHVITIEDPIEFVYEPKKCLINQREMHTHTRSFPNALRAALREDPDIVLVGEMRDLETIEIAIETAETGHLVFGTLHTNTAYTTVDRLVDKFPSDRQNQIRVMLADTLKGVVAQTLCKRKSGGRVAAMEVLAVTNAVAANIREGKTHMIPSAMQIGRNVGMQLFNDALLDLVVRGEVEPEEAYLKAVDKDGLLRKFEEKGIPVKTDPLSAAAAMDISIAPDQAQSLQRQIADFTEQLRKTPNDADALNNLAWIMATCRDPKFRNGKEATRLAELAMTATKGRSPAVFDTLSAAYAECGQFDKAIHVARAGLDLARNAGESQLARSLERQISMYENRTPMREG